LGNVDPLLTQFFPAKDNTESKKSVYFSSAHRSKNHRVPNSQFWGTWSLHHQFECSKSI